MITKFDVGDTVFVEGKVTDIIINSKGVCYTVLLDGNYILRKVFRFDESELRLKKKYTVQENEEKTD